MVWFVYLYPIIVIDPVYIEGVFVNGSIHWLEQKEWKIVTFDLADEEFR